MRTTITLDDRILGQLKKRAAESGTSVSRLVEQAVRLFIRTPPPARPTGRVKLITFGRGGRFTTRNIDKASALLEEDDIARFGPLR